MEIAKRNLFNKIKLIEPKSNYLYHDFIITRLIFYFSAKKASQHLCYYVTLLGTVYQGRYQSYKYFIGNITR